MASADTSIFSLKVGALPLDTFRVIEFIGQEAISECYHFTIRAVAYDTELKFEDAIGVAGALYVRGLDYEIIHYGVITAFTEVPDSDGKAALNFTYEFTLEPRLRWASYTVQSRIFQNKTVAQIAEEVLSDYLTQDQDFTIDVQYEVKGQDYPKREFTVQYNESDLDFLQRLLEEEGISYFFEHSGDREVLVISNKKEAIKPLEQTPKLEFRPETGLHADAGEYVDTLRKTLRWVSGSRTTLKDYNYRTPETPVMGVYDMEGTTGEFYHYGDHVKTADEAKRLAQIRAEMFYCGREIYHGSGIARALQSGRRIGLEKADAEGFNGEYLVVRVTHMGDAGAEAGGNRPGPHYRNSFEAIPASVQYRPPLKTNKPKAPGLLTAKVDGQKGSYAYIDEEGRYRMKLFFDRSEDKDGKASKAIRLAQPYAGAGYGMHFPLHTETEIAVGFVDGDLDRPIGLGAIPNPSKGSPVSAGNKHQNMMKSHAGNSLILEDKEGKTGVHIATSGGHALGLDDSGDTKGATLRTSGSNCFKLDDKETAISLTSKAGHTIKIDDKAKTITLTTAGGHILVLDDAANKISMSDGGGKTSLEMDGGAGNVSLTASNDITLTAGGSLSLNVAKDFSLAAKNTSISNEQSYSATSGKASEITAGTDLNLAAKNIGLAADLKLSAAGKMVESNGEASNKVGGAMVDINASGICTVAGATIKLN